MNMKKQKFNPELLKEELKRFRMLETYNFYQEEKKAPPYDDTDNLILGVVDEQGDEEAADQIGKDLGVDDAPPPPGTAQDGPAPEEPAGGAPPDAAAEPVGGPPPAEPAGGAPPPPAEPAEPSAIPPAEPAEDEEEVDVTALVKGSKEAEKSAKKASFFSSMLMKKLDDLEKRVADMDKVTRQIDDLEKEFKLRNPTNVEKLEMQSLKSGPYTQKLSDYWSDKEGQYDVMDTDKKKEYVLTKDTLDRDYSEPDIKKSFNIDDEDYEEEDF